MKSNFHLGWDTFAVRREPTKPSVELYNPVTQRSISVCQVQEIDVTTNSRVSTPRPSQSSSYALGFVSTCGPCGHPSLRAATPGEFFRRKSPAETQPMTPRCTRAILHSYSPMQSEGIKSARQSHKSKTGVWPKCSGGRCFTDLLMQEPPRTDPRIPKRPPLPQTARKPEEKDMNRFVRIEIIRFEERMRKARQVFSEEENSALDFGEA
eukprot:PhF_6_TR10106/c0_g1_i1/m.15725